MIEIDYDYLEILLQAKNLSHRKLALETNIPEGTLAGSFRRHSKIKPLYVWKIVSYLGIEIQDILKKDENGNYNATDFEKVNAFKGDISEGLMRFTYNVIIEILDKMNDKGVYEACKCVSLLSEIPRFQRENNNDNGEG